MVLCSRQPLTAQLVESLRYSISRAVSGSLFQATTYSSAGKVSEILYQSSCKWFAVPGNHLQLSWWNI